MIRRCGAADFVAMLEIINEAAQVYKGVIPEDRWHEPYMPAGELEAEIAAGVEFWGEEQAERLIGVAGLQMVQDVALIRHAYVHPRAQRGGTGTRLMKQVLALTRRPTLVGTWAASHWAIDFYRRLDFVLVSGEEKTRLLKKYWSIPDRQIETSVVLKGPGPGAP
jgi:N-acetylglutamate synthase-like GNAT family acetyltransferase